MLRLYVYRIRKVYRIIATQPFLVNRTKKNGEKLIIQLNLN